VYVPTTDYSNGSRPCNLRTIRTPGGSPILPNLSIVRSETSRHVSDGLMVNEPTASYIRG
jgi:hypothetical protein